jgi:hypothetical protein
MTGTGRNRLKQIARRLLGVALVYAVALQSFAAITTAAMAAAGDGAFDPRAWLCANLADPSANRMIDVRLVPDQERREIPGAACHFMAGCVSPVCSMDGTAANATAPISCQTVPVRADHPRRIAADEAANSYRPANARAPPLS